MGISLIEIEVSNRQARPIQESAIKDAVHAVLSGEGVQSALISVAIVDDPTIHEMNQRFLRHDEPTDVITFPLESSLDFLEGEIVVSADTAARSAPQFGWTTDQELLLYVVHGALHLAGYDDLDEALRAVMREREKTYLTRLGCLQKQQRLHDDGQ